MLETRMTYTIRQAHEATGIKTRTLQMWHQKGLMPGSVKAGRTVLIPVETLKGIVEGKIVIKG